MWHLHHLGFGQLYSLVHPYAPGWEVCRAGTTLLGILPDGYSVWIRAKFQPRPQCVCWTARCISGDHTGSISMFKSLCCPLSLSEPVPLGSRSEVQQQRGTCTEKNTCCWAANYLSTSQEPLIWLITISRKTHKARKKLDWRKHSCCNQNHHVMY